MFDLSDHPRLYVRQRKELAELFGFETRNKYEIGDAHGTPLGYAAEQNKSLLAALGRTIFGHWRRFDIHLFDTDRNLRLRAHHPFRFFFDRLEVRTADDVPVGAVQKRFSFFSKRFDIEDGDGRVVYTVRSPLWRIWTFSIRGEDGPENARIEKRWSGGLTELFTDADNFRISFEPGRIDNPARNVVLAAGLFVDLQYFEAKAGD